MSMQLTLIKMQLTYLITQLTLNPLTITELSLYNINMDIFISVKEYIEDYETFSRLLQNGGI